MIQMQNGGGGLGEGQHSPGVLRRGKHSEPSENRPAPTEAQQALARAVACNDEAVALGRCGFSVGALAAHFAHMARVCRS